MSEGKDANSSPFDTDSRRLVHTQLIRLKEKTNEMKQVTQFVEKRKTTLYSSSVGLISRIYPDLLLLYSLDVHSLVP